MRRRRRSSRIRRRISYPAGLGLTSTWVAGCRFRDVEGGGVAWPPTPRGAAGRGRRAMRRMRQCVVRRGVRPDDGLGASGGRGGWHDVWRRGGAMSRAAASRADASRGHQRRVVRRARSNGGGGAMTDSGAAGAQARPADTGRGRRAYSHARWGDGQPRREAEITRGMGRGYRRAGMSRGGEKNGGFGRNHFS